VAAAPSGHPLARRKRTRLQELARFPLICMPPGTGIRTVLDRACAAAGLDPEIALQASAPPAVLDLARRGLGVGVLSESMLDAAAPGLVAVPIAGIEIPAVLALVWRSEANPALRELVSRAREAFGDPARAGRERS
jgi:DNA-binding transcriptional LysR family regulator